MAGWQRRWLGLACSWQVSRSSARHQGATAAQWGVPLVVSSGEGKVSWLGGCCLPWVSAASAAQHGTAQRRACSAGMASPSPPAPPHLPLSLPRAGAIGGAAVVALSVAVYLGVRVARARRAAHIGGEGRMPISRRSDDEAPCAAATKHKVSAH